MAIIDYPSTLPAPDIGKSREQRQNFRSTDPFSGPAYSELYTEDSPVTWGVSFTCTNVLQARQFQAFLRQVINGQSFNMDILTEEGFIAHEVKFLEMPLAPEQIDIGVWRYSGVIYAMQLNQPDAEIDNDDLLTMYLQDSAIIDVAVNEYWPSL